MLKSGLSENGVERCGMIWNWLEPPVRWISIICLNECTFPINIWNLTTAHQMVYMLVGFVILPGGPYPWALILQEMRVVLFQYFLECLIKTAMTGAWSATAGFSRHSKKSNKLPHFPKLQRDSGFVVSFSMGSLYRKLHLLANCWKKVQTFRSAVSLGSWHHSPWLLFQPLRPSNNSDHESMGTLWGLVCH